MESSLDRLEWTARFTARLLNVRPGLDRFVADRIAMEQHRLNGDVWPERAAENLARRLPLPSPSDASGSADRLSDPGRPRRVG
ncbi:MAG: hypothetical protein ABW220_01985 [Burkholderiaceae bacterium]